MRIIKYVFLLSVVCYSYVLPQQKDSVLVLTLNEALNIALSHNWDVLMAQEDINKSHKQIDEAYSNAFPRLQFESNYMRNIKSPVMFIPGNSAFNPSPNTVTFEIGSKNSVDAGLSLSQVIYNQKVNTAIKIADEYASYSVAGKAATLKQVTVDVKKTFYGILLMQELVKVTQQSSDVATANLKNVESLYKQGVASEFDYLRAQVQVANTQPALIQTQNNLEMVKNALKNIMGVDINKPLEVKGSFVYEPIPVDTLAEVNKYAIENNPLVRQLSIQQSLLEKNKQIQRADYFPTLSFFGSYKYQTEDNTFKINDWKWANSFVVGLNLSYTLFDGFGRSARVQQVEIDQNKVKLGQSKLEEGLKIQIRQALLKMEEAKKRIFAQEKSLEQADKALKISQTRYKSGVGTQLEILDTQVALTAAQTNYAQAIYDYLIAKSDWEYAVSRD
ncbi:MAG: TolC family protein [Bacteroidota bacterium]|nr:TolC family protein [Bacteroidota bacterium]